MLHGRAQGRAMHRSLCPNLPEGPLMGILSRTALTECRVAVLVILCGGRLSRRLLLLDP